MDVLPNNYRSIVLIWLPALFLFAFPANAQNQEVSTFSGTVTEVATGAPIPGVSVYIAGSTIGSSTDSTGTFSFETQLTGNHRIVFSLIGYKTNTKTLEIAAGGTYRLDSSMKSVTINMEEVEIVSSNQKWKERFEYFQNQFIGSTDFAEETEISNPWVLDFKESDNILIASASKPLVVLNQALGYRLTIELVQFRWNTRSDLGIYRVNSLFEELTPDNEEERREWLSNRVEAFHGSQAHFFRSLYRGSSQEEDFRITHSSNLYPLSNKELNYAFVTGESTINKQRDGWKAFKLDQMVTIRYNKRLTHRIEGERMASRLRVKAGLKSNRKDKIFMVNQWGLLNEVASVLRFGAWGRSRIADSLPNNYTF
jgi:hypothetical protein